MAHPHPSSTLPTPKPEARFQELMPLRAWQKAIVFISLAYSAYFYFWWRPTSSFHPDYPIYSAIFYSLEVLGFFSMMIYVWSTYRLRKRVAQPIRSKFSVDVLIPTFNEDVELLRATIYHCVHMDYPHRTYVLDDGRRPEVAALARELGAEYLTRPDNLHAKAGNMNAALPRTSGDLIAVFDADGVPRRDFLTKLVGHFEDPKLALVQVPQTFFNVDSLTHSSPMPNGEPWNDQSLFYDICQPGRDSWDASTCCGNGSIVRRSMLEEVGGFTIDTATEDYHTTYKLHEAGYKTLYHPEPLAYCLSPADLNAYLVQRRRWALGSIQLVRVEWRGILGLKRGTKLTFAQRLSYLGTVYYANALLKLFYYFAPFLYLTFGVAPITQDNVLVPFVLNMALALWSLEILGRGRVRLFEMEIFSLYTLLPHIRALAFGFFPWLKRAFEVTPKRPNFMGRIKHLTMPVLVSIISSMALAQAMFSWLDGVHNSSLILSAVFAAFYLCVGVGAFIRTFHRPASLQGYAFSDAQPIRIQSADGVLAMPGVATLLAEDLVWFRHPERLDIGSEISLELQLPQSQIQFKGKVTEVSENRANGRVVFDTRVTLPQLTAEARYALMRHQFENAIPSSFRPVEDHLVAPSEKRRRPRKRAFIPGQIQGLEDAGMGMMLDVSQEGARMRVSRAISVGSTIDVRLPWQGRSFRARVQRCERSPNRQTESYDIGLSAETQHGIG